MPVPIIDDISGLPQVESAPVYETHEAILTSDDISDAAGNMFEGERFQSGNYTRIFVRKYAPDGVTLLGQWAVKGAYGWKLDGFAFAPAGPHLDVKTVAHDTPQDPANRRSAKGRARIANVFVPFDNQIPKAGAVNAGPVIEEGEPVDYDRIAQIVEAKVNDAIDAFSQSFGDDGPRKAIMDKAGDALLYMLSDSTEWKVQAYKDALFQFVKNANAGVQANILGGQDAWGVARRDELKAIVREVLQEIDEPTEGETTK